MLSIGTPVIKLERVDYRVIHRKLDLIDFYYLIILHPCAFFFNSFKNMCAVMQCDKVVKEIIAKKMAG